MEAGSIGLCDVRGERCIFLSVILGAGGGIVHFLELMTCWSHLRMHIIWREKFLMLVWYRMKTAVMV